MSLHTIHSGLDPAWFGETRAGVLGFLRALRTSGRPGRYTPCINGPTKVGHEMSLGWSCFALKLHAMLGAWEELPAEEREEWIQFIQSFQVGGARGGAFVDLPEIEYLERDTWRDAVWKVFGRGRPKDFAHSIVLAETKQAIATLAEVGAVPRVPFRDFPLTPEGVRAFFEARDWSRPWGAGGQSAGLVVFLKTQAPALVPASDIDRMRAAGPVRKDYPTLSSPEFDQVQRLMRMATAPLVQIRSSALDMTMRR